MTLQWNGELYGAATDAVQFQVVLNADGGSISSLARDLTVQPMARADLNASAA